MLKQKAAQNSLFQYFSPEALVPETHILRRIRKSIDFTFTTEETKGLYSPDWGCPAFDSEAIGRMFLLGYLYNLSDRRLCEDVSMHAGYRWFCGWDFNDPVPDQSTLVKLRQKWAQAGVFERIMDHVILQCVEAGLVDGSRVGLDGTQVTANAATNSLAPIQPPISLREYVNRQEEASDHDPDEKDPPIPPAPTAPPRQAGDPNFRGQKFSNQTHRSRTDPDARLYRKGKNQEAKLRYLVHNAVDLRSGVVLATQASRQPRPQSAATRQAQEREAMRGPSQLVGVASAAISRAVPGAQQAWPILVLLVVASTQQRGRGTPVPDAILFSLLVPGR